MKTTRFLAGPLSESGFWQDPLKKWHTLPRAGHGFAGAKGDGVYAAKGQGVDLPALAGFQGALRLKARASLVES